MVELRGSAELFAAALPSSGIPAPNHVVAHDDWRSLWMRPDGWLLIGQSDGAVLPDQLLKLEAESTCRITDMAHALVGIRVVGRNARDLLSKGTPLDLRQLRFSAGQCAHTWCAGFRILIEARGEGFDLYVDSALAVAFWHWLADAATEFKGIE